MNADEERAAYDRQLQYLTEVIERLENERLSDEEVAYLRNRKEADERAAWAWRAIKQYAPWVVTALTAAGSAFYWLATHSIKVEGPK